jgi:cation diffusion facilitator family transporter
MSAKVGAARLSVISNSVLIALKLIVGIITGSVSIISEAIHSGMDLLAALMAFFSVRVSAIPADDEHPYGHGKIENVSGVIEAILIFVASIWIIIVAVRKILHGGKIESIGIGFAVMFFSAAVNIFVSKMLYKVAREEESIALEADALHLKADVLTSAGVGVGLLLIWITGMHYLDPIVAILVALFIVYEAYQVLRSAFNPLLDEKLSDAEIKTIKVAISKRKELFCNFHELKTRRSGSSKYVDLHLVVPQTMSVKEAHEICDHIEADIESSLRNTHVMIHAETCERSCEGCPDRAHVQRRENAEEKKA